MEVGWRLETIQTTTLLRTARILRSVLETWGDLLSLKLQWKPKLRLMWKHSNEWVNKNINNNRHDWVINFETNHLISAKWLNLVIVNKKRTYRIVDFAVSAGHRVKLTKGKKKDKYLDLVYHSQIRIWETYIECS